MGAFKDLAGKQFGRLTVIKREDLPGKVAWKCVCICGGEKHLVTGALTSVKGTRSCGCIQKEVMREMLGTHGMCRTYLYRTWSLMIQRCRNPNNPAFQSYGARGISVCKEWGLSFEQFQKDVGDRPSPAFSLDRINNDDGYHPANMRWATKSQQARNRRSSRLLVVNGVSRCIAEWAEITGLNRTTIEARLDNRGWSPEDAIR